jgi:hypothetical protein
MMLIDFINENAEVSFTNNEINYIWTCSKTKSYIYFFIK